MGDITKKVGIRIRRLRMERRISQARLAEEVDLATQTISRIERGAQGPSLEAIGRLAEALSVRPMDLFDFDSSSGRGGEELIREAQLKALRDHEELPTRVERAIAALLGEEDQSA